ncbi:MAG: transglutaminase domain-containing protein [Dehalococcoidia bacterium]|nr:transglutaminase domain-containing protein [Dehalococcoidia bacterium]
MDDIERYLKPSPTIDSNNNSIRQKAIALTKTERTAADKAKSIFYWVRDKIKYNPLAPLEIFQDYRASKTLKSRKGFCVEKAAIP